MLSMPRYDLTEYDAANPKTGWFMAEMPVPYIAKYYYAAEWGEFRFTYYTGYDLDIYCDDRLIEPYSYMGGHFAMGAPAETGHYVYIRIDHPNTVPVSDVVARCYLSGLTELNELIKDFACSLRAGCHLLSKENTRNNLYLQGKVDIDRSKITADE